MTPIIQRGVTIPTPPQPHPHLSKANTKKGHIMTTTGTVSKWNTSKGWGFVKPEGSEDEVYVNFASVVGGSRLREGASVSFDIDESEPKTKKGKELREAGKRAGINVTGEGVIATTLGAQVGTVCEWNPALGYGFILGTDGSKSYVHESAFDGARLQIGKAVTYDSEAVGHKSGRAVSVNVGGSAVQQRGASSGTVKSWIFSKGFGFVEAGDQEVFVHSSAINNGWLSVGKECYFEVEEKTLEGEDTPKLSAVGVTGPALRDATQGQAPVIAKGGKKGAKGAGKGAKSATDKRKDTDGKLYTKAQFIEQYGGTSEWDDREQRLSPLNGNLYTKEQFKVWSQKKKKMMYFDQAKS